MKSGLSVVAGWLLTIGLMKAVLADYLDYTIFYNSYMGRTDISKHGERYQDDIVVGLNTLHCAEVSYPSLSIFSAHVDPVFAAEATIGNGKFTFQGYLSLVTVNNHGSPDQISYGNFNGHAVIPNGYGDSSMYVCVYSETPDDVLQPSISVDWMSIYSLISYSVFTASGGRYLFYPNVISCVGYYLYELGEGKPIRTALFNIAQLNASNLIVAKTSWIDSFKTGRRDGLFYHYLTFCTHVLDSITGEPAEVELSLVLMDDGATVNYGTPPLPKTYLTENGNVELDTDTTDWSLLCIDMPFEQSYSSTPHVFISASYRNSGSGVFLSQPPISGWLEFVNEIGFRACVNRPYNYIGPDAPNPSVEYLAISEDGAFDLRYNYLTGLKFFITFGLTFPADATQFIEAYDSNYTLVTSLMGALAPGVASDRFNNHGYMAQPQSSKKVYVFIAYDVDTDDDANYLYKQFGVQFASNYFPYISGLPVDQGGLLMDAMYPNGAPQYDSDKIWTEIFYSWGCHVGPYTDGECSVAECDGSSMDGIKSMARRNLSSHDAFFCPSLSIDVPCNLPPCSIEKSIFPVQPPATVHPFYPDSRDNVVHINDPSNADGLIHRLSSANVAGPINLDEPVEAYPLVDLMEPVDLTEPVGLMEPVDLTEPVDLDNVSNIENQTNLDKSHEDGTGSDWIWLWSLIGVIAVLVLIWRIRSACYARADKFESKPLLSFAV